MFDVCVVTISQDSCIGEGQRYQVLWPVHSRRTSILLLEQIEGSVLILDSKYDITRCFVVQI